MRNNQTVERLLRKLKNSESLKTQQSPQKSPFSKTKQKQQHSQQFDTVKPFVDNFEDYKKVIRVKTPVKRTPPKKSQTPSQFKKTQVIDHIRNVTEKARELQAQCYQILNSLMEEDLSDEAIKKKIGNLEKNQEELALLKFPLPEELQMVKIVITEQKCRSPTPTQKRQVSKTPPAKVLAEVNNRQNEPVAKTKKSNITKYSEKQNPQKVQTNILRSQMSPISQHSNIDQIY